MCIFSSCALVKACYLAHPSLLLQRTLEKEVKQCQLLIIWTDCDREGENIGFEIIDVCKAGVAILCLVIFLEHWDIVVVCALLYRKHLFISIYLQSIHALLVVSMFGTN